MSRILAYTSPARGHLYPATAIMLELRSRGHEVAVRTLSSELAMLRRLGLQADPIDPTLEAMPLDDWRARTPTGGLARSVTTFARRAPWDAADLTAAIERTAPDLVLVDINAWGALAAAERWGGRWAAFCPYPLALSSPDVPPFGPGLPPRDGSGRTAARPRARSPAARRDGPRDAAGTRRGALRARALALPHPRRPVHRHPAAAVPDAEPFEYPRSDWPDSIRLVGPCSWEPPTDPPGWLDRLDDPLVLVTTSSEFQDDGRLVRAALEGLADDPVAVVATVPAATLPGRVPANARVASFVPHQALLARASVAVTHAGMGATQKALAAGVPVVAVPFGRDQPEVARRVEVARAGVRLPAARLSPTRLREAVRAARARSDGTAVVAAAFAAAGGPSAAADALERYLVTAGCARPDPAASPLEAKGSGRAGGDRLLDERAQRLVRCGVQQRQDAVLADLEHHRCHRLADAERGTARLVVPDAHQRPSGVKRTVIALTPWKNVPLL